MSSVKEIKAHLKGYRQPDPAARDVHSMIQHYKDLKIGNEQYTFPEGRRDTLCRLRGTIPVSYRGTIYNIPVVIWLQKTHPQHNPIPYVTPTPDMCINPSRYVDATGRIYLPYITEWKQGKSDLVTLVQILCATFAENIPVYKRQQPQGYVPPGGAGGYRPPMQYNNPAPGYAPYPRQPQPTPYGNRPPYQGGQPSYSPAPYPQGQSAMPMPGSYNPPYPGGPGGYPQGNPPYPGGPQPPYPQGGPVMNTTPLMTANEERRRIEEEQRRRAEEEKQKREVQRKSLETAVEDKIKRQLQNVLERAKEEMTVLETTQTKLRENNRKLNKTLEDMNDRQKKVESSIETLKEKTAELESVIEFLQSQPDSVDPDEAVCASNPVYNQILSLYAEENAIDDAMYYLGEALRKGVITHEVFLKNTRDLSRKQFMLRATIMKARDTAKLGSNA